MAPPGSRTALGLPTATLALLAAHLPAALAHGDGPGPKRGPPVLFAHFICMLLSWFLLLPLGVVLARRGRDGHGAKTGAWLRLHQACQYSGWVLQLVGFACAVAYVQGHGTFGHFAGPHELLGLVVVALGTLQPLNALVRPHAPEPGEPKPTARRVWEYWHKGAGYLCVFLAVITVVIGIQYLGLLNYDGTTMGVALALAAVFAVVWLGTFALSYTSAWPGAFRAAAALVGAGAEPGADAAISAAK